MEGRTATLSDMDGCSDGGCGRAPGRVQGLSWVPARRGGCLGPLEGNGAGPDRADMGELGIFESEYWVNPADAGESRSLIAVIPPPGPFRRAGRLHNQKLYQNRKPHASLPLCTFAALQCAQRPQPPEKTAVATTTTRGSPLLKKHAKGWGIVVILRLVFIHHLNPAELIALELDQIC
ncbi:hypothetical protein K438DRAFT_1764700 [Mycena galopus ATCC 62051]|nr:hypothetical protein K438DRAFT_1764700 [Mycena galopus ATCC 62051]